jgi:hypothetical protein
MIHKHFVNVSVAQREFITAFDIIHHQFQQSFHIADGLFIIANGFAAFGKA